jgi:hypothetical protein
MELNFTELDNNNNNNLSLDFDNEKYWEQQKPKKKKVTFDDILSNMNLIVNKNGVLQQMIPIQNEGLNQQQYYNNQQYNNDNQQQYYDNQQQYNNQQQIPLDHNVKHSYIYNKYFKDYNDSNMHQQPPQIRVPKTIEEYKKMLLEDKLKQIAERNRISQIKSTKLLFTNPININVNKNKLNTMIFK